MCLRLKLSEDYRFFPVLAGILDQSSLAVGLYFIVNIETRRANWIKLTELGLDKWSSTVWYTALATCEDSIE